MCDKKRKANLIALVIVSLGVGVGVVVTRE